MDKRLTANEFTAIFVESLPNITSSLPEKAFEHCIKDLKLPVISELENQCLDNYTNRYLSAINHSLIYFSKKTLEI